MIDAQAAAWASTTLRCRGERGVLLVLGHYVGLVQEGHDNNTAQTALFLDNREIGANDRT